MWQNRSSVTHMLTHRFRRFRQSGTHARRNRVSSIQKGQNQKNALVTLKRCQLVLSQVLLQVLLRTNGAFSKLGFHRWSEGKDGKVGRKKQKKTGKSGLKSLDHELRYSQNVDAFVLIFKRVTEVISMYLLHTAKNKYECIDF
jgi:hypothetical protein